MRTTTLIVFTLVGAVYGILVMDNDYGHGYGFSSEGGHDIMYYGCAGGLSFGGGYVGPILDM